jgi:hypothetical protein
MIGFGAIVGGMIATSGDEAFVMLVQFPGTALALFFLLFFLGILFAWISDRIIHIAGIVPCEPCLEAHCEHCMSGAENQEGMADIFRPTNLFGNLRSLSFTRFLLLVLVVSFLALVVLGILGPSSWDWKRITFIGLSLCSLYIAMVSSEHYLDSHIWDHIIRRHLFRVFLWSFGAFITSFLFCGYAVPEDLLPRKGGTLPEIRLAVPKVPAHQSYLGLSGGGFFKIPDIKANVVIIEIYSMY